MYNDVNTLAHSVLFGCPSFFVDSKDKNKVSDEFEIWPDPTMDCGVSCSSMSEKYCTYVRTIQNNYDMPALR